MGLVTDSRHEPANAARSDLTTLARGGLLNLGGSVSNGILSFLLVVIVTQGFETRSGAGVFFEAVAAFIIASNIAELGADTGLVRFIARFRTLGRVHDLRSTLWIAFAPVMTAGILLAILGEAFAPQISGLFTNGQSTRALVPYIRVLALFLPFSCLFTVAIAGTRGFGTMVPTVTVDKIGRPLGQSLLAFVVLEAAASVLGADDQTRALAVAYALPIGAGFFVAIVLLSMLERRTLESLSTDRVVTPWRRIASEFWNFTAPRGLAGIFQVSILWLDTLLIAALADDGAAQTAVYTASSRYIVVGQAILIAVTQAIAPQISSLLAGEEHDRAQGVYQSGTAWLMLLSWPIFIMMAVFAPALVSVFGSGYAEGGAVLSILSVAMLVSMACGPVDVVLLMGGKSWWSLGNTAIALILNVSLNFLLIPEHGMVGAAVAWLVSIVVRNVLPLIQVHRFLHLDPFGKGFWIAAWASLATFGVIGLVARLRFGAEFPDMLVAGALATGMYLLIVWLRRDVLQLDLLGAAIRRRPS
jgi:O-antigen/teichoic acid export membrane protein